MNNLQQQVTQLHTYHSITGRQQECKKSVKVCACMCVYAAAHILSPVQIKPLPTIRSNDKQEDGSARSPDGRLEGRRGTRGSRATTPVCMITNPTVAGRHYRSAPWPSHKRWRFDIYTKLTCLRPYLLKRAQV